jgi:hypothetical protein
LTVLALLLHNAVQEHSVIVGNAQYVEEEMKSAPRMNSAVQEVAQKTESAQHPVSLKIKIVKIV